MPLRPPTLRAGKSFPSSFRYSHADFGPLARVVRFLLAPWQILYLFWLPLRLARPARSAPAGGTSSGGAALPPLSSSRRRPCNKRQHLERAGSVVFSSLPPSSPDSASSGSRGRSPVRRPSRAPPRERSASLELLSVAPAPAPVRSLSPAASAAAASDDEGAQSRRARYHVRRQRDSAPVPPPRRLQVPLRLRPPCRRHPFRVPVGGCCLRVSRVGPPSSCSHSRTPRATTCRRGLHHRTSHLPLYLLLRLVLRLELCLLLRPLLRRLRLRLLLRALPQRLMLRTRTFPSARPASAVAR